MSDVMTEAAIEVLSERRSPDGRVVWRAIRSADRGRLRVIGIVAPSLEPTTIDPLNEVELLALLQDTQPTGTFWICSRCGAHNGNDRRWCVTCSELT